MSKRKKTVDELLEEALVSEGEQPYEIPNNWVWVKLDTSKKDRESFGDGDWILSEYIDPNGEVRLIQLSDIGQGKFLNKSSRYISMKTFEELRCREIFPGDILISRMAHPIARSCIVPDLKQKLITAVDVAYLRPNEKIFDTEYLNYMFNSIFFRTQAEGVARGTTRLRITRKNLGNLAIPFPPLNEQKRIANKVERLLGKIEEAKQLIEEVKETFELRRAAILDKAFRGELTRRWREENIRKIPISSDPLNSVGTNNKSIKATSLVPEASIPDTWKWVLSNELFSFITSGSRGWAKYYSDDGDLFLRVGNLNHESIDIDLTNRQNVSPPEGTEGTRTLVQEGDILVSITADVGRIAVVPKQFPKAYINQHIALARPSSGYCIEYVAWFLSSRNGGRLQFDRLQRGATKAGLRLNDIKNVWLPVPSLEEQYEIVRKIQSAFNKFEVAEKSLTDTLEVYEELEKSILGKAFRGELGTNDPSEENAIELLKEVLQDK
ncbi:restriction endonuclease subunit S [Bacillus sp. MM09(2025)]|uniref:restriction endonuclease subunit S n=1 Tax=Bacillus sp. MM09(2025) TaxID=3422493 RepID=UPI003D26DDA8